MPLPNSSSAFPGAPHLLSTLSCHLNDSDSEVFNSSELTLVPDLLYNKDFDSHKVGVYLRYFHFARSRVAV